MSSSSSTTTNKITHVAQSRRDYKMSRELAEARRSGQVAPEVDVTTHAVINPHNPEFITKRPWYLGEATARGPSLDHQAKVAPETPHLTLTRAEQLLKQQRLREKTQTTTWLQPGMWVEALKRGRKPWRIGKVLQIGKNKGIDVEFEDGTVEKKVRETNVRRTKTGSRSIAVDANQFGTETYDSKRDAYRGYEITRQHQERLQQKYAERDELRRKKKLQTLQNKETEDGDQKTTAATHSDSDSDSDSDGGSDSDDEFVQRDEDAKTFQSRLARQGGVGGAQMKVTARNLRIREDTAKYLRNLNPNSAYYDPKSRSMRDNPHPDVPPEELAFAGDNFARISGDAVRLAGTQLFAWDAHDQQAVVDVHPQANPSQAEWLQKKYQTASAQLSAERKRAILAKYGGREYLDGKRDTEGDSQTAEAERQTRFGVQVVQEEYTRDGRLIKGGGVADPRVPLRSKYEEDAYQNGHTSVWGSYFHKGAFRWGYADDHSLLKHSYGTGRNGRQANDEANELRYGTGVAGSAALARAREMLKAIPGGGGGASGNAAPRPASSQLYGEANPKANLDTAKVQEALKRARQEEEDEEDEPQEGDAAAKKRKYNSLHARVDVTEEEMEAYRLRKDRGEDPMAKLADSEELLDYK